MNNLDLQGRPRRNRLTQGAPRRREAGSMRLTLADQAARPEFVYEKAPDAVEQLSVPDFVSPEPRLAHKLAHLPPRAIRMAVQTAVAHAIVNDRRYLKVSDLPSDAVDDDWPQVFLH
jgi:hypothetical protein